MNLEQISSRTIVRAPRSCRLREAAEMMRRHHVGALIVTDDEPHDGNAIGIVTDRDLVLQAMAEGIGPDEATLADVMTEGLATIEQGAEIQAAIKTMRDNGVRRLGVKADGGALVGVVAFDDLVAALAAQFTYLAGIIQNERAREIEQSTEVPLLAL